MKRTTVLTLLPADGSDVMTPEDLRGRGGYLPDSTQELVNPPAPMPKHKETVEKWLKERVAADAAMRAAAAPRGRWHEEIHLASRFPEEHTVRHRPRRDPAAVAVFD